MDATTTRFNSQQVDADERYEDPCIDDDAFVKDVVEDINDARTTAIPFKRHPLHYQL